jgi:hypothetical protein
MLGRSLFLHPEARCRIPGASSFPPHAPLPHALSQSAATGAHRGHGTWLPACALHAVFPCAPVTPTAQRTRRFAGDTPRAR